ncbi:hypothetical protein Leryth_002091 [Lithospermum erythrorhizon]|nr:hypothetical protein Leryth_002091 [Lithospermum erythrorhizon]
MVFFFDLKMKSSSVSRRTRLQEKKCLEKKYEEKFGKKLRKREEPQVSSRNSNKARQKQEGGRWDKDLKRKRVSEGSDESEDDMTWLGDTPGKGSSGLTQKKELEEKWSCGDNDDDVVILLEEVVSNHNSSRVPSSSGSGVNSVCVRERSSLESPEAASSCSRRDGECIVLSEDSSESRGSEDEDDNCSESEDSTEVASDDPDDEDFVVGVEKDASITSGEEEEEEEEEGEENNIDKDNEHDDVGADRRIHVSRNGESNVVEELDLGYQFLDDEKDGERNETLKEGKHKETKKKQVIEEGLIRQNKFGMDILSTCNQKGNNMDDGIAKRLRSRSLSESRRKLLKLGTIACPLVVDDMLDSSSDLEDKRPSVVTYNESSLDSEDIIESSTDLDEEPESSSDSEDIIESSTDLKDKSESSFQEDTNIECKNKIKVDRKDIQMREKRIEIRKRKSKKKSASNMLNLAKIISEKIFLESSFVEEKVHSKLPLKFTFEDENPVVQEKEEWEKDNEALFDEMELVLKATEIGSFDPSLDDCSAMNYSETELAKTSVLELCCEGKHNLKLEEDIGLICRNCSYVLEMKYIFPDFAKDPFRRWQKKILAADVETNRSFVNRLKFPNYSCEGNSYSFKEDGTVWDLIPGMKGKMYPHQHEGFEFIWEHLAGGISLDKLSASNSLPSCRNGCIINHAPGTGKTCLVIMFLLSFMRLYPKCRPVIVAPYSMLRNWEEEFKKWNVNIPFYNLNNDQLSPKEYAKATDIFGPVGLDNKWSRMLKCSFWREETSVLAISYQLFVKLSGEHGKSKLDEGKRENRQAYDLANEEWLSLTNSIAWKGDDGGKRKGTNYPFVHVYKGDILLELPGMKDSRIDLRPTALQAKLLNLAKNVRNYLRRKSLMSLVSIHPSLVSDCDEFSEDDKSNLEKLASDPNAGVKTKFVFELIRLCEALHERVLIFCSYVKPLKLIMSQLKSHFNWLEGREVLQMDGSADLERRKSIISLTNDPDSDVRVLLASTKASNEGINLVGASRVVILDVGFNPSVETQAISRAHRIGQKKAVYVYHLITSGTLEVEYYHSQNKKEHISKLVFSSKSSNGCCGASNGEMVNHRAAVLQDKVLELMVQHENLKNMFEQIYERPRAD